MGLFALSFELSRNAYVRSASPKTKSFIRSSGGGRGSMEAGLCSARSGGSTTAAWSPPRRVGWLVGLLVSFALTLAGASDALAQSTPRVLVFSGPSDATIDAGLTALETLGTDNNFEVDPSTNAADFTATNL